MDASNGTHTPTTPTTPTTYTTIPSRTTRPHPKNQKFFIHFLVFPLTIYKIDLQIPTPQEHIYLLSPKNPLQPRNTQPMSMLMIKLTERDFFRFIFKKIETEDVNGQRTHIDPDSYSANPNNPDPNTYLDFVQTLTDDESIARIHFTFQDYASHIEYPDIRVITILREREGFFDLHDFYCDCECAHVLHPQMTEPLAMGNVFDDYYTHMSHFGFILDIHDTGSFTFDTVTKTMEQIQEFMNSDMLPHDIDTNTIYIIRE